MIKYLAALTIALTAYAVGVPSPTFANATIAAAGPVIIVDGDTLKINHVTIRILEIDTPETYRPRCDNELFWGLEAKARLRELVDSGQVTYQPDGLDRYGRTLAYVYVDGKSVGDVLLDEALALPYHPGPNAKAARLGYWCH